MSIFPFSFLSLSKNRQKGSLSKGKSTDPALCLRASNVIKKEQRGKKKCTIRLTPEQYKNLKLREIGLAKTLTSNEIQTLKRTSEFALFDIITRPNRCTCSNNVCTC